MKGDKPKKPLADKPEGRLLTQGQRKLAGRLHDEVSLSMAGLEEDISEAEGGAYSEDLPPSLLPKCRLGLVTMKELYATLELVLSEGWRGDAKKLLAEVQTSFQNVKEVRAKLSAVIADVKVEIDQQPDQHKD